MRTFNLIIRMKHNVTNITIKITDVSIVSELETCGWYLI